MSDISAENAELLAVAHVRKRDLRGWNYVCVGISENSSPTHWAAVFDTFSPAGNLVDGPVIFLVDKSDGTVRSFEPE